MRQKDKPGISKLLYCAATALAFLLASANSTTAEGKGDDARATLINFINFNNQGKLLSKPALQILTGEAKSWNTARLCTLQPAPDALLQADSALNVARVQGHGQTDQMTDYYFYLRKQPDNSWKVEACRSLSSAGMVDDARKKLLVKSNRSEEENYQLSNMSLLLSRDAQLKTWFAKNKLHLDELCRVVRALPKPYPNMIKAGDKKYESVAKLIRSLKLECVYVHQTGEIQAIIGGVNRDFAGLLNSSGGKHPQISENSWIWIEDLGGDWFFFKHT